MKKTIQSLVIFFITIFSIYGQDEIVILPNLFSVENNSLTFHTEEIEVFANYYQEHYGKNSKEFSNIVTERLAKWSGSYKYFTVEYDDKCFIDEICINSWIKLSQQLLSAKRCCKYLEEFGLEKRLSQLIIKKLNMSSKEYLKYINNNTITSLQ